MDVQRLEQPDGRSDLRKNSIVKDWEDTVPYCYGEREAGRTVIE